MAYGQKTCLVKELSVEGKKVGPDIVESNRSVTWLRKRRSYPKKVKANGRGRATLKVEGMEEVDCDNKSVQSGGMEPHLPIFILPSPIVDQSQPSISKSLARIIQGTHSQFSKP